MSYTLVPSELIVDGAITSAKLDTNIAISGTLGVTGEVTLATHLVMGDNDKIKIGTGGDLEIYHDGSNSYIANSTGNIYIADTNGAVHIQAKLNEESIVATADGAVTLYHDNSAKLATASGGVTVTGTLTPSGVLTANAGVVVDNITIDGSTISDSGNLTIDAGGDIILDVDGADVFFKDNGTTFGQIRNASNNLRIQSSIQDADIVFRGDDGGSTITALTLDMSAAGAATFNAGVTATTGTFSGAVTASSVDASAGFLNGSNGGIRIHSGGTKFFNITAANAARDNHMDIGASDARFKGLYLGNKIFIGGLIVASNDAGRIGLNRNPDDGTHISSDSVQRFQINGPSSSGDYLDFQNYDTSGNYVGGFRIEDGAIRAEPMPVSTPSYSFDNDTDTGMTRPTGDTIQLVTGGTERFRVNSNGRCGIGTTSSNAGLHVANADIRCTGAAVANDANSISMSQESANNSFIVSRGNSTSERGNIHLTVSRSNGGGGINGLIVASDGSVSKNSGSFKIDHPIESKKDTHYLVHSFVEGPQADNIYRGVVQLENGTATINLDTVSGMTEGTFVALNTNISCFTSNETDWDSVKGSISGNILTINCQNSSSTSNVSWLVIGERHDQHMLDNDWTDDNGKVIVEPSK